MYRNLSRLVQQGAGDPIVEMAGKALVPGSGLKAGDAAAGVVGVEIQV
ncbi:MAG: hypothetical protein JXA93_20780 [Anaerolineae bacterium]|nr:hypothetical protein [Anaerolineae bacterium]